VKKGWEIKKDKGYMPTVSIIVPTYNEVSVIGYKLRNLSKLVYPKNLMQFVFVDSHSTDETVDIIRDFAEENTSLNIKIIVENERKGKTHALNVALKDCSGDVIVISDADCFWPPEILNDSLCYLADPSIGAISGPKVILNKEDSWVTQNESKYLESMNSIKLGESKTYSTILFEGGFAAFSKTALEAFDPYNTGSDDCGTVIKVLERNKRAIMISEAKFYTFFPKSWKGRTEIKVRRAVQLVRVLREYLALLSRGKIKTAKNIVLRYALLYFLAPTMFLCFIATTISLMLTVPLSILFLSILLVPNVNAYIIEAMSGFLVMSVASLLAIFKKKSLLWKNPEDRKLVEEQPLMKAGLV
jgi:cellulose synthase/poly-beta-1,6-N-acetylglucosamine synthase-like glycosyltransferase